MGYTLYSAENRVARAVSEGYYSKSAQEIFSKNMHESMNPKNALIREARDSDAHPNSVPIIMALDMTGSMRSIPHHLIKDGLPTIMTGIIEAGIPDPQVLFLPIGDATCDSCPLQVGQFEAGDKELDTWLTRTFIEGGGGGNAGESYCLAHYYAANHTVTDAWEKRRQKGFLFTIGDEPSIDLTDRQVNEIMGIDQAKGGSTEELVKAASEKWNIYHLHIMEGSAGHGSLAYWKNLLGQNCIQIDNHTKVPNAIVRIVSENTSTKTPITKKEHIPTDSEGAEDPEELLLG